MIIGHLGVAAALLRWRPRASIWWLVPAAIAPDLLDAAYALAGVCNPYGLYSHTVPAALLLATCLAAAAVLSGRRETAALVLLVVMLHLAFDLPTGRKLYWPGGEMHGLNLYDRPLVDWLMESALAAAGWALVRHHPGVPRWARSGWALAAALAVQAGANLMPDGRSLKPSTCGFREMAVATVPTPRRHPS